PDQFRLGVLSSASLRDGARKARDFKDLRGPRPGRDALPDVTRSQPGSLAMSFLPPRSCRPYRPEVEVLETRLALSSAQYVTALYNTLLHRTPQPAEVAGQVTTLNARQDPEQLALAFTTSPEYQTDLVQSFYRTFLGRQPSPTETTGWVQQLQAGTGE